MTATSRWLTVTVLSLLLLVLPACEQNPVALDDPDAQFAKGEKGEKGKGGGNDGGGGTYTLLEYFVMADASGGNLVHVVGEGDVPEVNLNVVHDNPFNGIRDNGVHYEYTTFAPRPAAVSETYEDGTFHIDIPWNGLRNDPSAEQQALGEVQEWFTDFLTTDIDGSGADPFAFDVRFQDPEGSLQYFRPQGIVMDGAETYDREADVTSSLHGPVSARSYATWSGVDATEFAYLTEVSFTNVQCRIEKIREGRGKNATTREVARVSGDFSISTGSTAGITPSTWFEVHLADMSDPDRPLLAGGHSVDDGNPADGAQGTLQSELDSAPESVSVALAVDYVFPTRDQWSWAYDPARNTNAGFTTSGAPVTDLDATSPTAFSAVSTINCN